MRTAAAPDNEDCTARGDEGGKQEERLRSRVMQPIVCGGGAQREKREGRQSRREQLRAALSTLSKSYTNYAI